MYRINTQTLLDVSESEKEQMEVKMSLFDKDYEIVLMENTALENTPAFYTDKDGNLKQDYPTVKLYAGYLKSDTTKAVRFSVMNNKYIIWFWICNFDIAFYQTGSYQIVVRAANKYGMGEYTVSGVTVYNANNNAAMIAYPNPANQTLYVDFSSIGEQQAKAINSVPVQQKQYDIRLFNLQGSLVRSVQSKGEQISIDVSGLPGGNYFLHIYNGESQKPLVQQIVIKH